MTRLFRRHINVFGVVAIALLTASFANAQQVGTCNRSLADAYLEANNVRARIVNTGGLFYRGQPFVYEVPRFSNSHSIFAGGIWIAGQIDGQLHAAVTLYGNNEYWAGPLDDQGNPPLDCVEFDHVFSIRRTDIEAYQSTGVATHDLISWPTGLGAPTLDASGKLIDVSEQAFDVRQTRVIDLQAGERPQILGDQTLWWIMNDRGNEHKTSDTEPIGIEVHATAFAKSTQEEAVHNSTYYRFQFINKNERALENAYIGLFLDPDVGYLLDDHMGSDSLLALGFAYNADDEDPIDFGRMQEGYRGYGFPPPAVGAQFIKTPLADKDGVDNDWDGVVDEVGEELGLSFFNDMDRYVGSGDPRPSDGDDRYRFLRGLRQNGSSFTLGGNGKDRDAKSIRYMYSGDPTTNEFWSLTNVDGRGTRSAGGDRKFLMSTGPFDLNPGEMTELVFSVVWARGTDHLDSVRKLKAAVIVAREGYEKEFVGLPEGFSPGDEIVLTMPLDGATLQPSDVLFSWQVVADASVYELEIKAPDTLVHITSSTNSLLVEDIGEYGIIGWRVRGVNSYGTGPWSEQRWFSTAAQFLKNNSELALTILKESYPNPLRDRATVQYFIANEEFVAVDVFDVQGRRVLTLVNDVIQPGFHDITIDAASLGSGVYFAVFRTAQRQLTRKLVVVR